MSKSYFIFDKNKCVACHACVMACMNENGIQMDQQWRNLFTQNSQKLPGIPLFHLSMACNHCDDAPCMKNCPALAYQRSDITQSVLHNADACIGCQYCVWQCPFEAPKFNPESGIIEKCHFCEQRLINDHAPACSTACPTNALDFSFNHIDKSEIQASIGVYENPSPSIKITELHKENGPEMDLSLFEEEDLIPKEKPFKHLELKKEWPLLIFTFIVSVLLALSVAGANNESERWLKLTMAISGGLGAILSISHLGKKVRMWRSVLNLKHSWLSREIFFFGLYYSLLLIEFFVYNLHDFIILIPGILCLLSIDMLYKTVQYHWKLPLHSGQSFFITLSLSLLLFHFYWWLLLLMIIRMMIQASIHYPLNDQLFKNPLFMIRWGLIDLSIVLVIFNIPFPIIVTIFLVSEFLDRMMFYKKLRIQTIL